MAFKTKVLQGILVAFAGLVVAGVSFGHAKSLGVVKVNYGRSIDDLPLYVGLEKGFWEQEGLRVELVPCLKSLFRKSGNLSCLEFAME